MNSSGFYVYRLSPTRRVPRSVEVRLLSRSDSTLECRPSRYGRPELETDESGRHVCVLTIVLGVERGRGESEWEDWVLRCPLYQPRVSPVFKEDV